MRRAAGVTLTAAALSVTLGVLIGAVITIGTHARTQSVTSPAAASTIDSSQTADPSADDAVPSSQDSDPVDPVPADSGPTDSDPSSVPDSSVPDSSAPAGTVPTTPTGRTSPASVATSTARSSSSTVKKTTQTPRRAAVITTLTVAAGTSAAPTPSTSGSAATSTAARADTPAAGRPCSVLGEKATVADGSTVFCQRNFAVSGALAWRAVVDGGGCLNRQMTGRGADGRNYLCRADANGADHWRRGP